jgi:DNA-binding protein H-NS
VRVRFAELDGEDYRPKPLLEVLSSRASELQKQLAKIAGTKRGRPAGKTRKKIGKVAPQFRSKKDPKLVWSGRGGTPRWMKDEMKGTKLKKASFRIKG